MKTLLVPASQVGFADAIRAVVDPQRFRVVHFRELREAETALVPANIDACIFESDLTSIQPIRVLEGLRKKLPQSPILVFAGVKQWEWEEEAYLHGVIQVLGKPVRARLLNLLLERICPAAPVPVRSAPARPAPAPPPVSGHHRTPTELLGVLRDFSAILSHSLHADLLLKEFLLLLREIIGVNRAAIFLRQPPGTFNDAATAEAAQRLRASCAIGLPPGLLGQFDLTLTAGIGGYIARSGRILRRESPEAESDLEMQKEFELLGTQVAVPVLDRENLVGVALFDGRITGEPLVNGELGLIFCLLEQLGMAIRNIWLHDQVLASHEMMTEILRQFPSACLVVSWDLNVLHSNDTACACFGRAEARGRPLEFTDLPQVLGGKVFEVLKTSQEVRGFRYARTVPEPRAYRVTITPFRKPSLAAPTAALVFVEDCTDEEKVRALEVEAANLRLVRSMAQRLSHEVGNAIVPLSTHQQLFDERRDDPEFLESLREAMDGSVKRIARLSSQMLYLAQECSPHHDAIPVDQLIQEAFKDAQLHQPESTPMLVCENGSPPAVLHGDHPSLRHALCEVLLNALQAVPKDAKVSVRTRVETDEKGVSWLNLEIRDNGAGFTAPAAEHAVEPFFTTRNVGLGLGLTVCQKIITCHQGTLRIEKPDKPHAGVVRILLPLEPALGTPSGNGKH